MSGEMRDTLIILMTTCLSLLERMMQQTHEMGLRHDHSVGWQQCPHLDCSESARAFAQMEFELNVILPRLLVDRDIEEADRVHRENE